MEISYRELFQATLNQWSRIKLKFQNKKFVLNFVIDSCFSASAQSILKNEIEKLKFPSNNFRFNLLTSTIHPESTAKVYLKRDPVEIEDIVNAGQLIPLKMVSLLSKASYASQVLKSKGLELCPQCWTDSERIMLYLVAEEFCGETRWLEQNSLKYIFGNIFGYWTSSDHGDIWSVLIRRSGFIRMKVFNYQSSNPGFGTSFGMPIVNLDSVQYKELVRAAQIAIASDNMLDRLAGIDFFFNENYLYLRLEDSIVEFYIRQLRDTLDKIPKSVFDQEKYYDSILDLMEILRPQIYSNLPPRFRQISRFSLETEKNKNPSFKVGHQCEFLGLHK